MTDDVTDDLFFGGRLRLLQPKRGHRFGGDAALLVAAARSRLQPGARVVDLGAGVGAVGLALLASGAGAATLVEIDSGLAALAGENAARNGLAQRATAVAGDVAATGSAGAPAPPGEADLVVTNPPFDPAGRVRASPDPARALAHVDEGEAIAVWTDAAARLLRPGGALVMIHRADMLGDLLPALGSRFGALRVLPVHPRADAPAGRALIAGVLGGKGPLALKPGLVMHGADGRFTPEADAAQRGEAMLDLT